MSILDYFDYKHHVLQRRQQQGWAYTQAGQNEAVEQAGQAARQSVVDSIDQRPPLRKLEDLFASGRLTVGRCQAAGVRL